MGCLPIPSLQSTISSAELLLQKFLKCQQRLTYREKKKAKHLNHSIPKILGI